MIPIKFKCYRCAETFEMHTKELTCPLCGSRHWGTEIWCDDCYDRIEIDEHEPLVITEDGEFLCEFCGHGKNRVKYSADGKPMFKENQEKP